MKRFLSSSWARLFGFAAVVCLLLAAFFRAMTPAQQFPGARLTSPEAQQRQRSVAAHEGLNQAAATASRLASEQDAELAQIRQWQKTRQAASSAVEGGR